MHAPAVILLVLAPSLAACGPSDTSAAGRWHGSIDTLPSGAVTVTNPATGMWDEGGAPWSVELVTRIGSLDEEGPAMLGNVAVIEVDGEGRVWILESQAQELRVFDRDGNHVRTIGRKGQGPGEFNQVNGMAWAPDGHLWVVDPSNNRISVIDTAGSFVESHPTAGGFVIFPWRGGFDDQGFFYTYLPMAGEGFRFGLVKLDAALQPVDTIIPPQSESEGEFFELRSGDGWMRAGVPFTPGLEWQRARNGNIWFALTGEYRLGELTQAGDTLRIITREFDRLPVTAADVDGAIADLEWFTSQGGKIDRSKFPGTKPAIERFFLDDGGNVWVIPVVEGGDRERGDTWDIFDPAGRYLGRLTTPVVINSFPPPVFRRGMIYAVSRDELDVPYVVVLRVDTEGKQNRET